MVSRRTIRIPMKVTVKTQTRLQSHTRFQVQSRHSFGSAAWIGPMGDRISNHYGDINTITGDGNQVAIGISGSVTQISWSTPVDPDRLRATLRELEAALPILPLDEQDRDALRTAAGQLLDEADSTEPDKDQQRRLGVAISEKLLSIGTTAPPADFNLRHRLFWHVTASSEPRPLRGGTARACGRRSPAHGRASVF